MKRQIFSLFLLLLTLVACGDKPLDPNKPVYVKIKTTMGDVHRPAIRRHASSPG